MKRLKTYPAVKQAPRLVVWNCGSDSVRGWQGSDRMEGMTVALDLLSELALSDGHLKHCVLDNRVSLYNGMGNAQLTQPVTEETFRYWRDNSLIGTDPVVA